MGLAPLGSVRLEPKVTLSSNEHLGGLETHSEDTAQMRDLAGALPDRVCGAWCPLGVSPAPPQQSSEGRDTVCPGDTVRGDSCCSGALAARLVSAIQA